MSSLIDRSFGTLRPARPGFRVSLTLTFAAALAAGAAPAVRAQAGSDSASGFQFVVSSGALVPTGVQRDAIARAEMTTAQLSYLVLPNLAVTSSLGWSRSRDLVSAGQPTLDVFTYDLGAEARANRWVVGDALTFSPFVGVGAGARSYNYRSLDVDATHNLAAFGSVGGEIGYRRIRLRLEARDYLTGFKPLAAEGTTGRRNDLTVMAGLRFTAR